MNEAQRLALSKATQAARILLEVEFQEQLEGTFDIRLDGTIPANGPPSLSPAERHTRIEIHEALETEHEAGPAAQIQAFVREAAFTTLNRFVALKLLEARDLVQECVSEGVRSKGFGEFGLLAPGLADLSDQGYRLYLESLFDEISTEVGVLFDRLAPGSLLWPRRRALQELLDILNHPDLGACWAEDESIGWVYQYFNSADERRALRKVAKSGPRNSRELAVLNQFFTPRYVVEFLVDNTLGRLWWEMSDGDTALRERCAYLMVRPDELPKALAAKDPRDFKILDPACGSGHFLLYSFDLLTGIYREAWERGITPVSEVSGRSLRDDYPTMDALHASLPVLILHHNLFGVDIDPRAAQIASLALWLRAQRAFKELAIERTRRAPVRRTHIVIAEPLPGDVSVAEAFFESLDAPLDEVARELFTMMELAGDAGTLLRVETDLGKLVEEHLQREVSLWSDEGATRWADAEQSLLDALRAYADRAGSEAYARRLFSEDTARGLAFIDLSRTRFDVVLMNPPFGESSVKAKDYINDTWPRTRNDLYAAFVERGLSLLLPRGKLGAITSRTGFFLTSFRKWREEILLKEAEPIVVADLGYGVLDAMVETAAYCLEVPE
jgi:23S rRNA G2445 N2-methylase RlmL